MPNVARCISRSRMCIGQGWKWEDEDWHVDMAGASETSVDADGWSYAVDFPWLRLPPLPGSGRQRKVYCLRSDRNSHATR